MKWREKWGLIQLSLMSIGRSTQRRDHKIKWDCPWILKTGRNGTLNLHVQLCIQGSLNHKPIKQCCKKPCTLTWKFSCFLSPVWQSGESVYVQLMNCRILGDCYMYRCQTAHTILNVGFVCFFLWSSWISRDSDQGLTIEVHETLMVFFSNRSTLN